MVSCGLSWSKTVNYLVHFAVKHACLDVVCCCFLLLFFKLQLKFLPVQMSSEGVGEAGKMERTTGGMQEMRIGGTKSCH